MPPLPNLNLNTNQTATSAAPATSAGGAFYLSGGSTVPASGLSSYVGIIAAAGAALVVLLLIWKRA